MKWSEVKGWTAAAHNEVRVLRALLLHALLVERQLALQALHRLLGPARTSAKMQWTHAAPVLCFCSTLVAEHNAWPGLDGMHSMPLTCGGVRA